MIFCTHAENTLTAKLTAMGQVLDLGVIVCEGAAAVGTRRQENWRQWHHTAESCSLAEVDVF